MMDEEKDPGSPTLMALLLALSAVVVSASVSIAMWPQPIWPSVIATVVVTSIGAAVGFAIGTRASVKKPGVVMLLVLLGLLLGLTVVVRVFQ